MIPIASRWKGGRKLRKTKSMSGRMRCRACRFLEKMNRAKKTVSLT